MAQSAGCGPEDTGIPMIGQLFIRHLLCAWPKPGAGWMNGELQPLRVVGALEMDSEVGG